MVEPASGLNDSASVMSRTSIACIAQDEVKAVRVLDDLKAAQVSDERISVLLPEKAVIGGFQPATETASFGFFGNARGRAGLLAGALDKLSNVCVFTPTEAGRFMGAGPMMEFLSRSLSGTLSGSLGAELARVGFSKPHAEQLKSSLASGKVLLTVSCTDTEDAAQIRSILINAGAHDVIRYEEHYAPHCGAENLHHREAA